MANIIVGRTALGREAVGGFGQRGAAKDAETAGWQNQVVRQSLRVGEPLRSPTEQFDTYCMGRPCNERPIRMPHDGKNCAPIRTPGAA
jgi:hypothetical protein